MRSARWSLFALFWLIGLARLSAAEAEVLTLKDGRHLTGVYDERAQVLDMGMAKVPVAEDQIAGREAAPKPGPAPTPAVAVAAKADHLAAANAAMAAVRREVIAAMAERIGPEPVNSSEDAAKIDSIAHRDEVLRIQGEHQLWQRRKDRVADLAQRSNDPGYDDVFFAALRNLRATTATR